MRDLKALCARELGAMLLLIRRQSLPPPPHTSITQLASSGMYHIKVDGMPPMGFLEEFPQAILSQHLSDISPSKKLLDKTRSDLKV